MKKLLNVVGLLLSFILLENTAFADCYTCFTRYKVSLTMKDRSVLTGYTIAGYSNDQGSLKALIDSERQITLYEDFYISSDQALTWKSVGIVPEFYLFSDRTHQVTTKDIDKYEQLSVYFENGIPIQIPNLTMKRLTAKPAASIHRISSMDMTELYLVSFKGDLSADIVAKITQLSTEIPSMDPRTIRPFWDSKLKGELQLNPDDFIFLNVGSGC